MELKKKNITISKSLTSKGLTSRINKAADVLVGNDTAGHSDDNIRNEVEDFVQLKRKVDMAVTFEDIMGVYEVEDMILLEGKELEIDTYEVYLKGEEFLLNAPVAFNALPEEVRISPWSILAADGAIALNPGDNILGYVFEFVVSDRDKTGDPITFTLDALGLNKSWKVDPNNGVVRGMLWTLESEQDATFTPGGGLVYTPNGKFKIAANADTLDIAGLADYRGFVYPLIFTRGMLDNLVDYLVIGSDSWKALSIELVEDILNI